EAGVGPVTTFQTPGPPPPAPRHAEPPPGRDPLPLPPRSSRRRNRPASTAPAGPPDMAWLREPLASRLRRMAWRLPDLRLLLSQRFAALDQLGAVRFGARSRGTQWLALVALSVVVIAIVQQLKLPGGIMIGAMLAAIVVATADRRIHIPTPLALPSQPVLLSLLPTP